jgi:hypothetical protein
LITATWKKKPTRENPEPERERERKQEAASTTPERKETVIHR